MTGTRIPTDYSLSRWGVLVLNLGTPKSPEVKDVRRYLTEFLMDPFVIDIPWIFRWVLVHGIIGPFRSPKSSHAYKLIWTEKGSPLSVETAAFAQNLRLDFIENPLLTQMDVPVEWAYRYGEPDMMKALVKLHQQKVDRILVFPLYPQYAESTTLTCFEHLKNKLRRSPFRGVKLIESYHSDAFYIDASVERILHTELSSTPDAIQLSFHSLPVRHILKASSRCEKCVRNPSGCKTLQNDLCYRGQCYETARKIEETLKRRRPEWQDIPVHVSFQSKLGKAEWLTPITEETTRALARGQKKHLLVVPAGFTTDCLETLEELDVRLKEVFLQEGGQTLTRVSCLNGYEGWTSRAQIFLKQKIEEQLEIEREDLEHVQNERAATTKSKN